MKNKKLALMAALMLLLFTVTGCLPQIIKGLAEPKSMEATKEVPEEDVQLPSAAPIEPAATQPAPAKPEDVYSGMDYVRVYADYPQDFDLDGDGSEETLTLQENFGSPDSETIGITVEKDGQTYTEKVANAYLKEAFVAYNVEGKPCFVISHDYASDDYETLVYKFDGEQLVCVNQQYGYVEGVYDGVWMLRSWVYIMGTWNAYHKYTLSPSFTFEPVGLDLWMIQDAGPDRMLTAKTGANAQFIENGTLVAGKIEAGERLLPYATDTETIVYFRMADGRTGLLSTECREGHAYIDGQKDETMFENILYAG